MKGISLFMAEFAKLKAKKGVLFTLIGVLLIPIVYAAVQLSPKWGPYDNLSNLPVAVVNLDKGSESDGEPINVGEDLVKDLKKSKNLGWEFVDSKQADKGLKENRYYMVIEIPEDFSQRVTTVMDSNPKKLELHYIQNEGLNFMAAQVTNSATERIREQLANKITEKYVKNIFSNLSDVAGGFQSAADGSQKLFDGSSQLKDGTGKLLQSLNEKSDDITKLAAGSQELNQGTAQLLQSLQAKSSDITALANGTKTLQSGTNLLLQSLQGKSNDITALAKGAASLETGATQLKSGTGEVLAGLQKSKEDSDKIVEVVGQLAAGSKQVAQGVTDVQAGATQLAGGSQQLTAGLEGYLAKHPELQKDADFLKLVGTSQAVSKGLTDLSTKTGPLKDGANAVAGGLEQVVPGTKSLSDGLDKLVTGQTTISKGAVQLVDGSKQLARGTKAVNEGWKTMTGSVAQLNDGAKKIKNGNNDVKTGWNDLTAGVAKIDSGMDQVSAGNATVHTGWNDLIDGVTKVDNGVGQLNGGSKELAEGLNNGAKGTSAIETTDPNIAMFSSPVELMGSKVNKFERYRDSTAPFVISLALFVGALVLSFFVDFKKPVGEPISAFAWFSGKFMTLTVLALVQGLLVTLFTLVFLHLNVENGFMFVVFGCLVSIAFMILVWFLVALGGNAGRFLGLVIIVLQLSITGANLPIEMLPSGLRSLSTILPMTYSIGGFKSVITLGDLSMATHNLGVIVGYLALFLVLTLGVFFFSFKRRQLQDI